MVGTATRPFQCESPAPLSWSAESIILSGNRILPLEEYRGRINTSPVDYRGLGTSKYQAMFQEALLKRPLDANIIHCFFCAPGEWEVRGTNNVHGFPVGFSVVAHANRLPMYVEVVTQEPWGFNAVVPDSQRFVMSPVQWEQWALGVTHEDIVQDLQSQTVAAWVESLNAQRIHPRWDRDRFDALATLWQEETRYLSSPDTIAKHHAYQEIIRMGEAAIPWILMDLGETYAAWFLALQSIAGESAVKQEHCGDVYAMTADWLDWGKRHHYI